MRVLQGVMLIDVLVEWGFHESQGRLRDQLPPEYLQGLDGPEGSRFALEVILRFRSPVIANMLVAIPMQCIRVEIQRADMTGMRVMGPPPPTLREYASRVMAQDDDSGGYVRTLASGSPVAGPFVAVARAPRGPITLLDGLHRAAAWVAQGDRGRDYPLFVNLVVTQAATWYEGE